ncbi:isoleucyl-tRNA synthetase [Tricholoma matsutake]|nr:isoleucyl-tRNA synthetase [Tricholoma matsutake 945]
MNSRATVLLLRSCISRIPCSVRPLSSYPNIPKDAGDSKLFSNTLLLPKTSFPLWADPSKREVPFQKRTCEDLYLDQWENRQDASLFVLHDGPPYANGDLHMGHALNKILKDIINRYHVSLGYRVHYIPGWDCHGLPIENKALQELRQDLITAPPNVIRAAAEMTAKREIESQKAQFRHLGIMADWSAESTYRTLDHPYEMRQLKIFQSMVDKGLIYRNYRPVHYSPSSRSALAEAELVYKDDHVSHSVYVEFEVNRKSPIHNSVIQELISSSTSVRLLVWTTTPWTLTANMGIAVHPELTYVALRPSDENQPTQRVVIVAKDRLEYLKDIIGPVDVIAELHALKIIPGAHVTSDSGTGLVHCAPAHGGEDYQAFLALNMLSGPNSMICHVNAEGKFTAEVANVVGDRAARSLIGQEVLTNGSKAVVELLKMSGSLVKVQRIKHRYPYDWKTNEPIIMTATSQWFADLSNIKGDALEALSGVSFYPPASRNRLESFIRSRSEWCISRQRVWGVPIPALHHLDSDRVVLDVESLNYILSVLEKKGVAYWWDGPVEDFVSPSLLEEGRPAGETWRKGTDTMDVWFDSGTSWSMLPEMGVGRDKHAGLRKHHAEVCVEGSDQHRGWFQSQLLTAIGSAKTEKDRVSPYGTLITHGMVLDEAGKKMSKSLGNIVSPLDIVLGGKDRKRQPAYGADVLRLWVASVEHWRDMSIGPTVISQATESLRKIRNSARFMLGNIGDKTLSPLERVLKAEFGLAERYVMHELSKLEEIALKGYGSYNFPQELNEKVVNSITNFSNITLSSLYFDITKDCLYANHHASKERRAVVTVLEQVLNTMTTIIGPILPHLAEEINSYRYGSRSSVFVNQWTRLGSEWMDIQAEKDMNELLRVRGTVLSLLEQARGDKRIKSSLEAEVDIVIPFDAVGTGLVELLQREENFLKTLFIVSDASVTDEGSFGASSPEWVYSDTLSIPGCDDYLAIRVLPAAMSKCPRCWTFTRSEAEMLCPRCTNVVHELSQKPSMLDR